jgi:hypothetical protein
MKPRTRPVTVGVAILGAAVIAVTVAVGDRLSVQRHAVWQAAPQGGDPMGTDFEVIVDVEVSSQDAEALANKVTQALLDEGIILPYRDLVNPFTGEAFSPGVNPFTGEAFGPAGQRLGGFPAGPNAPDIVAERANFGFGFPSPDPMFDTLEVITGRQFHGASEEAPVSVECPSCKHSGSDPYKWLAAAEQWKKTGTGVVSCNHCGETSVLEWKTDPLWVFGNLGLQFRNWPKLHRDFIDRVSDLLGHRIVVVQGMF